MQISSYFVNTTTRAKSSIGFMDFVSMPNRKTCTVTGKIAYGAEHDLISHIGGSVARGESWTLTWKAYCMSIIEVESVLGARHASPTSPDEQRSCVIGPSLHNRALISFRSRTLYGRLPTECSGLQMRRGISFLLRSYASSLALKLSLGIDMTSSRMDNV